MVDARRPRAPSRIPHGPLGTRRDPFSTRHATGLTIALFFGLALLLSVLPVPERLRPLELGSPDDAKAVLARVLKKPRMTLASLEQPPATEELEGEKPEEPLEGEGEPEVASATSLPLEPLPEAKDPPDALLARTLDATARATRPPTHEPGHARARDRRSPSKPVAYLRKLARALEAPGAPIENPCVAQDEHGCVRTALDPFFVTLDAVDRGERGSHATVVTLGNSLIASDHVTDIVRKRLTERFGSGGRGFLLPERLSKVAGRRVRTGRGTPGWEIHTFAQKPPKRDVFGFGGSAHESTRKGDKVRWTLEGASRGQLFYLDHPEASPFELFVDGKKLARVEPSAKDGYEDRILELSFPEGGKVLSLVAEGPGVILYGVALAKDEPGVVWDTIGVPASDASMYVATDEGVFLRQLGAREPALVVVMLGGNEIRSLSFGWTTLEEIADDYAALLDRVKRAAPDAACLAVAPIDAAKATAAGAELTTRPEVFDVVAMERKIALEKGCAFFNLFEAMGGAGSLERFHRKGLVHEDLVHPKGKGGDVLGQLFADALLDAYVKTPLPRADVKARRRLVRPKLLALSFPRPKDAPPPLPGDPAARPLRGLFAELRALEKRKGGRVAIGQFGAQLGARPDLADRLRERLADRFGAAGRGFVPVGPPDQDLLKSRVTRRLSGKVDISDGRHIVLGGAVSMNGTKARLSPGARFDVTFCDGCKEGRFRPRGTLELVWLFTPDMGTADVYVNEVHVGVLSPDERRKDSDVQFLTIPVRGEAHTLSVQVRDEKDLERMKDKDKDAEAFPVGPVHLFSVAGEVRRPGVVVDAVGLLGSTGMTLQRWRQDLIAEQVAQRRYDLILAAWGENEAALSSLDEFTYRHHFENTVRTLLDASPGAECILIGPIDRLVQKKDRFVPAPSHEMVERVQREVAALFGCGFFDAQEAMGGRGAVQRWVEEGLLAKDRVTLTQKGAAKLADLFLQDLLALYAYDTALEKKAQKEQQALEVAKKPAREVATKAKARRRG